MSERMDVRADITIAGAANMGIREAHHHLRPDAPGSRCDDPADRTRLLRAVRAAPGAIDMSGGNPWPSMIGISTSR